MQCDRTQIKLPDEEQEYHDNNNEDNNDNDDNDDDDGDDHNEEFIPIVPLGTNKAASFPANHILRS